MKSFKEYCVTEHPNLRTRIKKAIDPREIFRDKIDNLKKMPGELKDKAINKLKDKIDTLNPLSAINAVGNEKISANITKLRIKKKALTTKAKGIGNKIKTLKAKKTPKKKT
jgi:hypothetical protein